MSKRAVVAHGGGPTAVLNSSLAGLIAGARGRFDSLYGSTFGFSGILSGTMPDLLSISREKAEAIGAGPGSVIGSSRRKLSDADMDQVIGELRRQGIGTLFYTGGNGSMRTALEFARRADLQVIGIPKTIDNDLYVTHHAPGYASTAYFFGCAARDAGTDCRSLPSPVCVLETLGRNAGWIVAATWFARRPGRADDPPHLIYLPEHRVSLERIASDVQAVYRRLGYVVIAVCEGQLDENGNPFGADVDRPDSPGHRLASNLGHTLARRITEMTGLRARAEKPGLIGRSCGAFARERDRREAFACGHAAAMAAVQEKTGVMAALDEHGGTFLTPLETVAGRERLFPSEWIADSGNDVTPAFAEYAAPLIGPVEEYETLI